MGNENDMNENLWSACIYINQYLELLSTNRAQTLNKNLVQYFHLL